MGAAVPGTHELWVLDREAGGPHGGAISRSPAGRAVHVRADDLAQAPAVVLASERMDENPGWRLLDPGELVHVDRHRCIQPDRASGPPAHR